MEKEKRFHYPTDSILWNWVADCIEKRADQALIHALESKKGTPSEGLPTVSRSYLKRLIEDGQVTLNGRPLKANSHIKLGENIQIIFPAPKLLDLIPEKRELDILYEDEHLLVINKPPGMTVHPSSTQANGTLVNALLYHIKDLSGIGGTLRPGIVHRIDKNTSGSLVISKTDLAHLRLGEIFAQHQIERTYWALCYGSPNQTSSDAGKIQKIESLIGRSLTDRKKCPWKSQKENRQSPF